MSLASCIQRGVDAKLISKSRAEELFDLYEERVAANAHLGAGADAKAALEVYGFLQDELGRSKRLKLQQLTTNLKLQTYLSEYTDLSGQPNPARALLELVEWGQHSRFQNVSGAQQALSRLYRGEIGAFIEQHKRTIFGEVRNKALLPDIVRELHGESSGSDAAKDMADAINHTFDMARLDFNAAGGNIGKLKDFGVPHQWDQSAVAGAGFEAFRDHVMPRLDWDRMIDFGTMQPFSAGAEFRRKQFVENIYRTISTGGSIDLEPSGMRMTRSTANRRADPRIMHFRSADAWMEANELFGRSDAFTAVVTHLDMLARDTAMMRILGPNPRAGLEFASQTAEKLAAKRPWKPSFGFSTAIDEARGRAQAAKRMLDVVSGSANVPEMDLVASVLSGTRHFLTAAQLGAAQLSAVTDHTFIYRASKHVGLRPSKVIGRHLRLMSSSATREQMKRMRIISDGAASVGVAQARFMGETYGPPAMERLSEFVMRSSGLTAWTDLARNAFRMEFYGHLAENAGRAWEDIDAPLRELVFEQRGITAADWDVIRETQLYRDANEPDVTFLVPEDILHRDDLSQDAARLLHQKLASAILEQTEFAVPSSSIRGRAILQGGAPGTFVGELTRSGLMYKSFVLSLMFNQFGRIMHGNINGSRIGSFLGFVTMTTVAGALSLQLKDMARGRDPRPMNDAKFWYAAMIQGGGIGIFGDFLYATENRFGGGLSSTLAGPVAGLISDTGTLGFRAFDAAVPGETAPDGDADSDKFAREMRRYLDRYAAPTNLWYVSAAFDRMVLDNLQRFFDEGAEEAWERSARTRQRDFGQTAFWAQGEMLPARAPDFSNVVGAEK